MKILALTVLMAVAQIAARSLKQVSKTPGSRNEIPAALPNSQVSPAKPGRPPENAPQTVTVRELPRVSIVKDWSDWGVWGFSGLLVLVGFLQWRVIRTQANLMREHAGHLKNLADATRDNAAAAKANAEAARASSEAFLNAERAWIFVETGEIRDDFVPNPNTVALFEIAPVVINRGRTVGRMCRLSWKWRRAFFR